MEIATVTDFEKKINEEQICFHCGDTCTKEKVAFDNKTFCCNGCKMVFEILSANNLDNYYKLNQCAGDSQKNYSEIRDLSYLDQDETQQQLIDFTDGKTVRIHFYLPQIHCSSCIWLLEHLHLLNENITESRVNFLKKDLYLVYNSSHVKLSEIVILLTRIGYAPLLQLNDLKDEPKPAVDRSIYYKLGLSGFVFGNIMLLSFPEYLGIKDISGSQLDRYFAYLNFALILPVVIYSGKDYFISAFQGFKQKHLNIDVPISIGILALFIRSSYEIFSNTGAGYFDSLAGLIFFLLIGKWFQQITYNKINFDRDYRSYFPIACTLVNEDREQQVRLDQLKKGDIIRIRHGELIPSDAVLLSNTASIDYSFVSGESDPVKKDKGDQLYAGGRQLGGLIEISVLKKVSNSYLTQLWNNSSFQKSTENSNVSKLANTVATYFTITILLIAFLTLFYWIPIDISKAVNAFTAVLIIACPCAVALSIPFTFGNVIRILARKGIYIKNTNVIESLAKINHLVFDKTGTLTQDQSVKFSYSGNPLNDEEKSAIYSLARQSIHPKSVQIASLFSRYKKLKVENFKEEKGKGICGTINGIKIRLGSAAYIRLSDEEKSGRKGSSVFLEINEKFTGQFLQENKYRKGLKKLFEEIKKWADISLLSGDNDHEKDRMSELFGSDKDLNFYKTPQDKLDHIKKLQNEDYAVAMIGDGLNDAGALSQSDVGIAITDKSSYFSPSSDIIMESERFTKLPGVFRIAKQSINLIYISYFIAFMYNVIGLSFAVQATLSPVIAAILMPLSSISILLFGVFSSSYVAFKRKLI